MKTPTPTPRYATPTTSPTLKSEEPLCLCWLGKEMFSKKDAFKHSFKGLQMVVTATADLRSKGGDDVSLSQAYRLEAITSRATGTKKAPYRALERAARHAEPTGDPLLVGAVSLLEAQWRNQDDFEPDRVLRAATTAVQAFTAAAVPGQLINALEELKTAHHRAGSEADFLVFANQQLAQLPPNAPAELRGYLRCQRGQQLIAAGRFGESIDDLTDGLAQPPLPTSVDAEHAYYLVVAYHGVGQFKDAAAVGEQVVGRLTSLREKRQLRNSDLPEQCHMVLAESHERLRNYEMAIGHYLQAAAGTQGRQDLSKAAFATSRAADLLDLLDRDLEAAEQYRVAGDLAGQCQNLRLAAHCRSAQALALCWAGDVPAALDALSHAEHAVSAVPAQPVVEHAGSWAQLNFSAAHILASAGRELEAASRAGQAGAAYRIAGESAQAAKSDLLQGQLLLKAGRPDLAEPVLRGVSQSTAHVPQLESAVNQALADTLDQLGRPADAAALRNNVGNSQPSNDQNPWMGLGEVT